MAIQTWGWMDEWMDCLYGWMDGQIVYLSPRASRQEEKTTEKIH